MLQPDQLALITEKFKKYKIKRAYAFGSVCTGKFNENSDYDFLVSFSDSLAPLEKGENYWDLLFELEDTLERKIDLLIETQLKNPYLMLEINKTKKLIYGE